MIRTLIADDEPKIRRGLASLVSAAEGFSVVAEAENGVQALEAAKRERPDLILVDIRMPLMSGLEFVRALEKLEGHFLTIIVSGHDEFRYAQEAVKLHVFDYILKPIKPAVLEAVLTRAKNELEARMRNEEPMVWALKEIEKHREVFRELTLREWFLGALSGDDLSTSKSLLKLELPETPGLTVARVQARIATPGERGEGSTRLMAVVLRRLAEEVFAPYGPLSVFEDHKSNLVVISSCAVGQDWVDAGSNLVALARQRWGAVVVLAQKPIQNDAWVEGYKELTANLDQRSSVVPMVVLTENHLEKTYMDPKLTLEGVASDLGLSAGYLSRLLRQQTGHSFTTFLARFRIQKAVGMLADPTVKVQTVAKLTGYTSQHYFARSFKKILGVPPQSFRRSGGGT